MDDKKALSAYHEAAHAVLAHELNVALEELYIEREKGPIEWTPWTGSAQIAYSGLCAHRAIRIALVGALAQAKFKAISQDAQTAYWRAKFDIRNQVTDLVSNIVAWNTQEYVDAEVSFTVGNKAQPVELNDIEGDLEVLNRVGVRLQEDTLRRALVENMKWLDNPLNWDLVSALAERLRHKEPKEVQRVKMTGSHLVGLIKLLRREVEDRQKIQ